MNYPHISLFHRSNKPNSQTRPLARALVVAVATATASGAVYLVGPTAPAFADTSQTLDFGVVAPGSWASQTANFVATATGSVSASATPGFQVADLETYHMQRERVDVDPGELPPGMQAKPVFEEVRVVDQHVDGSGPLDVTTGQHFTIYVDAEPTAPPVVSSSARSAIRERVGRVKRTSTCLRAMSTCRSATQTSPSPRAAASRCLSRCNRSAAPRPTSPSTCGTPSRASRSLDPVVHVGPWQTVSTVVHIAADRGTALGTYNLPMSATAFDGLENEGVADIHLTVTPLPVLHYSVNLGQVAVDWDQARSSNCEVIKDLMGRAVLAAIGRTIRARIATWRRSNCRPRRTWGRSH